MAARMSSPSSSSSTYPRASAETRSILRVCQKPMSPAIMIATSRPPTAIMVTRHGSTRTPLIQPKTIPTLWELTGILLRPAASLHYTCRRYAGIDRRRRPRHRAVSGARPGRPRPHHLEGHGRRGGRAPGLRRERRDGPPGHHAAPPRRPAGSPAHPPQAPRAPRPDAHGPRRGAPQGGRAGRRGRRLPHEALRPRGAPGPDTRAHPPLGPAVVLEDGLRRPGRRPPLPARPAGGQAGRALQPRVRPAGVLYAPPWPGPEPAADPLGRLGLLLRPWLERGGRLRPVP